MANPDLFDAYFRRADLDHDGKISGQEAVAFFQGSSLPNDTLAKIWQYADRGQTGSLSKAEFYNALKLVTVAQTGRQLTPDIVRAALAGPASSQIPPPRITPVSTSPAPPQPQVYRPPIPGAAGAVNPQLYGHGVATTNHFTMPQHSSVPRPSTAAGPGPQRTGLAVSGAPAVGPSSEWPDKSLMPGRSPSLPAQSGLALNADSIAPGLQVKANSLPSVQSSGDVFGASTFQTGGESNGPKVLSSSASASSVDSLFGGDVFTATPSKPAAVSSQPKPVMTVQTGQGFSESGSRAVVPTTLPTANAVKQPQPVLQHATPVDVRSQSIGIASPSATSGGLWPKMSHPDVQRYTKVFMEVDTDRDGKISGDQARELFLSWRLPREALKQIWDLSDQDHDGMLSLREFCMALYLMERFREGRTLPSGFSSGLLLDESAVAALRIAEAQAAVALHSAGINVPVWQQNPGVLHHSGQPISGGPVRPVLHSTVPGQLPVQAAGDGVDNARFTQPKLRTPVLEMNLVSQLNADDQQMLRTKHKDAEETDKKVQELEKEIMDSKEKMEFYRTKLQEIILFKTRCDNRLAEITERAAADKREAELLAKRYDEKFKQAGESNSRLLAEEAAFRDIQERKLEIYNALVKIDQGGDGNTLLQSRADRIHSDLEELRKALNEKSKRLGLRTKPIALIELPYGWQPGVQENATDWDEDWDKFDDEGFSIVQDLLDEATAGSFVAKPTAAASWDDNSLHEDGLDFSSGNTEGKEQAENLKTDAAQLEVRSPRADSENGSIRSGAESPHHESSASSPSHGGKTGIENSTATSKESQRYAGIFKQEFTEQGTFDGPASNSTSEQGPPSSQSGGDLFGDDGAWASVFSAKSDDPDVDVRASWGLQSNPPSGKVFSGITAQAAKGSKPASSFNFSDSFDMLSGPARVQENDLQDEFRSFGPIRTREKASIFFDSSVPSTPLFNTASPARRSNAGSLDEHIPGYDHFARFDSFSSNRDSGQNTSRDGFTRFDSFSSGQDAAHPRGFTSFDESDPFAGTGPFAATGQTQRHSTDTWSAFS